MNEKDARILRAIMEGMTEDLDMMGKQKTWERMLLTERGGSFDPEKDFLAPLSEMKIDSDFYHRTVVEACRYGIASGPSLDYPEVTRDRMGIESPGRDIQSYLSTEELMMLGQAEMIKKLKQMEKSQAFREKLARKVMIKLV